MTTATEDLAGWSIGVAEEVDIPGWVYVPADLTESEQSAWVSEVGDALVGLIETTTSEPGLPPALPGQVQEVLRAGLLARAGSTCEVMYQVWPIAGPASVICEINATRTADLPDWSQMPGRVHEAEARYIGPGLQYATHRVVDDGDGPTDLNSVHFVFADVSYAFVLSLQEGPAPLIAQALIPLTLFKDALTVTRQDGQLFTSSSIIDVLGDSAWAVDQEEGS